MAAKLTLTLRSLPGSDGEGSPSTSIRAPKRRKLETSDAESSKSALPNKPSRTISDISIQSAASSSSKGDENGVTQRAGQNVGWGDGKRWFQTGVEEFRAGDLEKAIISFTRAIGEGARRPAVFDSRAAAYLKLGEVNLALNDAKMCIAVDGKNPTGYLRASRIFELQDRLVPSLAMLKHAIKLMQSDRERQRHLSRAQELETRIVASAPPSPSRKGKEREDENAMPEPIFVDPVDVLPYEIWAEIFDIASSGGKNPSLPFRLASVSRTWRSLILGHERAWTNLVVSNLKPIPKIKTFLTRSNGRLKYVKITVRSKIDAIISADLLKPSISQLRGLRIEVPTSDLLQIFLERWQGQARTLVNLEIISNEKDPSAPTRQMVRVDGNLIHPSSRSLETFALRNRAAHLMLCHSPLESEFRNLKSLSIAVRSFAVLGEDDHGEMTEERQTSTCPIKSTLQAAPALESLELSLMQARDIRSLTMRKSVKMKKLKMIDIDIPENNMEVPRLLKTPELSIIKCSEVNDTATFRRLLDHLRVNFDKLEQISAKILGGSSEPLQDVLSDFANLQVLDLTFPEVDDVIRALSSKTSKTTPCPLIRHLCLRGSISDARQLCSLVRDRFEMSKKSENSSDSPKISRLDTLQLIHTGLDPQIETWLRKAVPRFESHLSQSFRTDPTWANSISRRLGF